MLAVLSTAGLGAIDVIYVALRAIPRIYLADAVIEIAFIAAWIVLHIR